MQQLIKKPYLIFWISIPFVVLYGWSQTNVAFCLNIHDTYYVTQKLDACILLAVYLGTLSLGYWLVIKAKALLNSRLVYLHMGLTIFGLLFIFLLSELFENSGIEPYQVHDPFLAVRIIAVVVVLAQVLYPIILIKGFLSKRKK